MSIKLIVGLANPGAEYAQTRHNAGEWFIDALMQHVPETLKTESKFFAQHAQTTLHEKAVRIAVPTTYMNESGRAVASLALFYKVTPEEILIVHDDLDLDAGVARLKLGGGHGGHNGLRNIIQALNSPNFHRLRLGIGHPGHRDDVVDFVLKRPTAEDRRLIDDAITRALNVMPTIMKDDIQAAMKTLHT